MPQLSRTFPINVPVCFGGGVRVDSSFSLVFILIILKCCLWLAFYLQSMKTLDIKMF